MPIPLLEDKPLCDYPKKSATEPPELRAHPSLCDWPGNVRELEPATRRILFTRSHAGESPVSPQDRASQLSLSIAAGTLDADARLAISSLPK